MIRPRPSPTVPNPEASLSVYQQGQQPKDQFSVGTPVAHLRNGVDRSVDLGHPDRAILSLSEGSPLCRHGQRHARIQEPAATGG
jgi:hypothetical protein